MAKSISISQSGRFRFYICEVRQFSVRVSARFFFLPLHCSNNIPRLEFHNKKGNFSFSNTHAAGFYLEPGVTDIKEAPEKPMTLPNGGKLISAHILAGEQNKAIVKTF